MLNTILCNERGREMMINGTVKWFDDTRGFGFISGDDGRDYFVHHSNIVMTGFKKLLESQRVEFEVEESEKGRKAINVVPM